MWRGLRNECHHKSCQFFYITLRVGTPEEIQLMFKRMDVERKRSLDEIIQLVYFMRGSVQYRDMMNMTLIERQAISEFIEKRLEAESKKMYPIY